MSIRESGGSVVDASTEQSQVTIEGSIIERTQFDSYGGRISCDAAGESEERDQSQPSRMSVGGREVVVTDPCKFQRKREREMSFNRQDQAVLSAKNFNGSAKKGHIFSVIAK